MHCGFLQWDAQTTKHANADTKPRNEAGVGHPSELSDNRSIKIPADLRPYLTTTSQSSEIYVKLHESRERRLRLLLRRFTNQIQYGCKNPFCQTPTCFSYRKRHSNTPVRPYTDVAARALAWRCVEDYGNNAGNTDFDAGTKGNGKRKKKRDLTPCERGDGLCWNEPVIPWYSDATEYLKRRQPRGNLSSKTSRATSQEHDKGTLLRTTSEPQWSAQPNLLAPRVSKIDKSADEKAVKHAPQKHVTEIADNLYKIVENHKVDLKESAATIESVADVDAAATDLPRSPPRDTASFTQSLYDTAAIKLFHQSLPAEKTHDTIAVTQHEDDGTVDPMSSSSSKVQDVEKTYAKPSESIYTFRILNKRVMTWLVTLVSQQPEANVDLESCTRSRPVSIASLARQSLHYCLSHPFRLLESAEAWRLDSSSDGEISNAATRFAHAGDRSQQTEVPAKTSADRKVGAHLLPNLDDAVMAFDVITSIQPYTRTLDSIFAALQHAYVLPPLLHSQRIGHRNKLLHSPGQMAMGTRESSTRAFSQHGFLNDQHVASLCVVSLFSLANAGVQFCSKLEFRPDEDIVASTYISYLWCRETGQAFPHAYMSGTIDRRRDISRKDAYLAVLWRLDANDDMHVLRLLEGLADVISHRVALHETLKTMKTQARGPKSDRNIVDSIISLICQVDKPSPSLVMQSAWSLLDLMCIVLVKKWDKLAVIQRRSSVGGALQMLAGLYRNRTRLRIPAHTFTFKFIAEALDVARMPLEWLSFREDTKQTHILSFSFLFDATHLVKYFRAINIEIMRKSYHYASVNHAYAERFLLDKYIPVYGAKEVLSELRPHMVRYFVLTVRRQHMLEDAIDQIWRRQHQELMRPLKVSLGKGEGEDGLDHGGVQQEFFRMIFAEALDVDYGMFTIDDGTRMTWFQPGSLEPLYKFEALGILMSLAVYNSVTLPITFPLAFYRKLLGLRVKHLEHIEDGWPELTKGLRTLQTWSNGDVGEDIVRTYEFSYRVFGKEVLIDMSKIGRADPWPCLRRRKSRDKGKTATFEQFAGENVLPNGQNSKQDHIQILEDLNIGNHKTANNTAVAPNSTDTTDDHVMQPHSPTEDSADEAPLVTNANRDQYIKDYIFWLTDKSISPQFEAFSKGFHTCLDATALSIFTPEALKTVIEGHTEIDIEGLEAAATYDDFVITDQTIIDFWTIVKDMSPEQHRHLLEFVTASDRVPVSGISSVTFIVQKNGEGDDRLPSSSTCYGRLLLPKYSTKEIMRAKLEKAIENSVGFGSL